MTNQEAFDAMVRHLRKQGRKSQKPGSYSCLYYGADGLMCAVGCLIPEDQYSRTLEYHSAVKIQDKVPAITNLSPDLLDAMQMLHDNCPIENWEAEFLLVAYRFCLTLPPLEATHA